MTYEEEALMTDLKIQKSHLKTRLYEMEQENDKLKAELKRAYQDCIDIVNRLKDDPITDLASHTKIQNSTRLTAKHYMVAFAEDAVKAIEAMAKK